MVKPVSKPRPWLHALLLGLVWVILTGGDPGSWVVGAPAVMLALAASWRLSAPAPWRLSLSGFLAFAAFFIAESFRGGLDVARRVFDPRLPLEPGLIQYRLQLPLAAQRVLLMNVVSLLPGSLSAEIDGRMLTIHALDARAGIRENLQELESRVARLCHITLPEERGS